MNFKEFVNNTVYYHGSNKPMPIGTILRPQPQFYTGDPVEDILEKFRPPNKLSRKNSIFLVDKPEDIAEASGNSDYVYIVEPTPPLEKSDVSWWSEVQLKLGDNDLAGAQAAAVNYWNGVPYPDKDLSVFEYRCPSAKLIQEVK